MKFVVPVLILAGALVLFFLFKPSVYKKFKISGQVEFTKHSQVVQFQETADRLRGRFKFPADEVAEFASKNELERSIRSSPHDDIVKEYCTKDRLRKVTIRFNEQRTSADIDILEIAKYPGVNCSNR